MPSGADLKKRVKQLLNNTQEMNALSISALFKLLNSIKIQGQSIGKNGRELINKHLKHLEKTIKGDEKVLRDYNQHKKALIILSKGTKGVLERVMTIEYKTNGIKAALDLLESTEKVKGMDVKPKQKEDILQSLLADHTTKVGKAYKEFTHDCKAFFANAKAQGGKAFFDLKQKELFDKIQKNYQTLTSLSVDTKKEYSKSIQEKYLQPIQNIAASVETLFRNVKAEVRREQDRTPAPPPLPAVKTPASAVKTPTSSVKTAATTAVKTPTTAVKTTPSILSVIPPASSLGSTAVFNPELWKAIEKTMEQNEKIAKATLGVGNKAKEKIWEDIVKTMEQNKKIAEATLAERKKAFDTLPQLKLQNTDKVTKVEKTKEKDQEKKRPEH